MLPTDDPIVICGGVRTPIGHISKGLCNTSPVDLMSETIKTLVKQANLPANAVNSVLIGWVGQGVQAPNLARVAALKSGLPETASAYTIQNNCVSSIEAISAAARQILTGESEVVIAGGAESMSTFPYVISGSRSSKPLRSMDTLKDNWPTLWDSQEVTVMDTIEQGLTDPVQLINMAGTAEVCAQMYDITKEAQDSYAHESYKRALDGEVNGFYKKHTFTYAVNGTTLEKDEYPYLRENLVKKPAMLAKAGPLFDNKIYSIKKFYEDFGKFIKGKQYEEGKTKGSVTLFNSCARSDGAGAVIVTRESKAKALNLPITAKVKSWAIYGNNPAYMGVAPLYSTDMALKKAGMTFDQIDQIELHEPFAATCLSIFHLGKKELGQDWETRFKDGKINPNGGSIALGHPLGATGIRLFLNLSQLFKDNPNTKTGLITSCAGGGIGFTTIFERP
ncbi:thiolase family protein [Elusimicrobiota bacterium]